MSFGDRSYPKLQMNDFEVGSERRRKLSLEASYMNVLQLTTGLTGMSNQLNQISYYLGNKGCLDLVEVDKQWASSVLLNQ